MDSKRRIKSRLDSLKKITDSSQAGVSLIEVMTGLALTGVGAFLIMNGIDYIDSTKSRFEMSASQEAILSGLVESIRSNISMEKIDFKPEDFLNASTVEDLDPFLKLCWFNDGILPREQFPNCQGKLGYAVYPLKIGNLEYRGMYKVTIKITHEKLIPGAFDQYEFIVKD